MGISTIQNEWVLLNPNYLINEKLLPDLKKALLTEHIYSLDRRDRTHTDSWCTGLDVHDDSYIEHLIQMQHTVSK